MNSYLENLKWRYATKIFDNTRKVDPVVLKNILASIQLSPSAYGLQPYEVLVIENEKLRKKLKSAAYDQSQVTEASHLIVFASYNAIDENYINSYLTNISNTRKIEMRDLQGFLQMLKNSVLKLTPEEQATWSAKQAYLAMGNFLSAAANYKVDACPMEGFDAKQFDEILNLKERGLTSTVIAPIGYRSEEDKTQNAVKVRKSKEELFQLI